MFSCHRHAIVSRNAIRRAAVLIRKSSNPTTPAAAAAMSYSNMAGIAVFSSICMTAVYLGVWQTQRYAWKVGLIEDNKSKLNDPAGVVPAFTQSEFAAYVHEMTGRRVCVTGKFDHSKEVLVGPRSAPAGLMGAVAQGLALNPQGHYIITPFTRDDGTIVFINRGWVDSKATEWNRPEGTVTMTTIISEVETKNTFSPKNEPATMKLFWVEDAALRSCAALPDLKLDEVLVLEQYEKDNIPVTSFPAVRRLQHLNKEHVEPITHMVYAITWFSLAAAGAVMTYYKFRGPVASKIRRSVTPKSK